MSSSSIGLFDKFFSRKNKKKSESDLLGSGTTAAAAAAAANTANFNHNNHHDHHQHQANNSNTNSNNFKHHHQQQSMLTTNNENAAAQSAITPTILRSRIHSADSDTNFSSSSSSSSSNFNNNNSQTTHSTLDTIKEEDTKRLSALNLALMNSGSRVSGKPIDPADVMHKFHVTNYKSPTYCDYCSQLMIGLIKQGVKCEFCGLNFHKKCVQNMPRICNKQLNQFMIKNGCDMKQEASSLEDTTVAATGGSGSGKHIELEHSLVRRLLNSKIPVFCDHCKIKISNQKYYWYCQDCQINVHEKCAQLVVKNCKPAEQEDMVAETDDELKEINNNNDQQPSMNNQNSNNSKFSTLITSPQPPEIDFKKMSIDDQDSPQPQPPPEATSSSLADSSSAVQPKDQQDMDQENMELENKIDEPPLHRFQKAPRSTKRNQIGLQRISQRVKKTNGYFWSGHMIYYTNQNPEIITHYWKLDAKSINIYDSYRLERKLKSLELENIKKANLCGLIPANSKDECINDQKCLFVIRTTDNEDFYCGLGGNNTNNTMNILASNFYNMFKMVYLPYSGRNNSGIKISAPKYEEKSLKEEYTINPQELLGSGQFGQVYAGYCKANNQPVAIKVIDKTRFRESHAETTVFQNEITILYNVQHPGIVRLMALFDEIDNLYIVTEKMATDMLEMILNRNPARLTERIAKFVIFQILVALQKLHESKIAHCDLKPENILLTENIDFPQVKICDFGYAKIIGENSFRRSMVGTPAYSPPELKQRRLYNNSIDMWSMGVITYVSLSGTFPFEEDRDIYEQIMNSNFLFPPETWDSVSTTAIDLITHFLQVKINLRASAGKALLHKWFSGDQQLHDDLVNLENKVNHKWLTEKWSAAVSAD